MSKKKSGKKQTAWVSDKNSHLKNAYIKPGLGP
jgi:hypothetical protein